MGGFAPVTGWNWGFLPGSFAADTGQCLRSTEQLVPRALLEQWAVLSRQGSCLLAFYSPVHLWHQIASLQEIMMTLVFVGLTLKFVSLMLGYLQ